MKGGMSERGVVTVWSKEDDTLVRKTASRVVGKKWEFVKLCINVSDENCEIVKEMKLKERVCEKISWSEADERNFEDLKVRNVRYLNLKESKQKEIVKRNVLQEFRERNGNSRKKGVWEKKIGEEIESREIELKETFNARKVQKEKDRVV